MEKKSTVSTSRPNWQGLGLAAGGKIDEAVALINDVIAKADPENQELYARAYVALGNCYKAAGKPKDALLAFLEVDLLYPTSPEQHAEALANLATSGKGRQGRPRRAGPQSARKPLPAQPLGHQKGRLRRAARLALAARRAAGERIGSAGANPADGICCGSP